MKTRQEFNFPLTAVAAGLLLAFGLAHAQESEDVARLIHPDSSVSAGVGHVNGDTGFFGQYTGQKDGDTDLNADVDVNRRDDATGTWLRVKGRNLGLDQRALRVEHERQGNWGYFIEYGELKRQDPLKFMTPLGGRDSTNQSVNLLSAGSPASEFEPSTKRESVRLGLDKTLGDGLTVQLRFRNEEKDGTRNFGFYNAGASPMFIAEPIDQRTQEFEATVGYADKKLQLSGGYLGSFFQNANNAIHLNAQPGVLTGYWTDPNIALAPDNQEHGLHLSGGYNFTPSTRGTFKVAYTRGLQDDSFYRPGITGQTSLDGKVDTSLVTFGLSSRVSSKLSLNGTLRYEDRDDKTPRRRYFNVSPAYTGSGFNNDTSRTNVSGKLDATYRLPMSLSLIGGLEWDERTRAVPESRSLNWRSRTEETSARLGLRRSLAENLKGSVSYVHSERTGSSFKETSLHKLGDFYSFGDSLGQTPRFINPIHWADRTRDKIKANLDWAVVEALSMQFVAQYSHDSYDSIGGSSFGNDKGRGAKYSVDATYRLSEDAQFNAWASRDDTRMRQRTIMGYTFTGPEVPWSADLRTIGTAAGIGAQYRATEKLRLDAQLQWSYDRSEYDMTGPGVTSLPDITYRHVAFSVTADYAVRRDAGVKLQYVFDKWKTNDWTWSESIYGDGTFLDADPNQRTNFIGVSAYYKWF